MKKQILISLCVTLCLLFALSSCSAFCKHEYAERVVPSTCVAEGYTEYTCTKCGESYKENFQPVIQHYFLGGPCTVCGMQEITENITPDTTWYNDEATMFTLTTKEQLAGLASLVNNGNRFVGKIVYLGANIDLGYYEWIPIGNAENSFDGKFDADGHTVSSLKINASYDYVGLFGNANGSIINLNVNNASIFVGRDYSYVAIVCGHTTSDIDNVTTKGFVEAPKSNCVGAIAGKAYPGEIVYSKLTNYADVKGANNVGGILGEVYSNNSVQTDKLINKGDVTGTSCVGGIFGYISATTGSSVYNATSSANIVADYYVGGIVGRAINVGISTCSNEGSTITANAYFSENSIFYVWLGGYVGCGYSVDNCTNNANIKYDSRGIYIGGIIGYATGTLRNCTNNGSITTYTNDVGGIAGHLNTPHGSNIYTNLTNNGDVTGKDHVGGIAGRSFRYGKYIYSNSSTQISALYNTANISGENYVGGLIGSVDYTQANYYTSMHLTTASHSGSVSGISNCGELFGYFNTDGESSITNYTVTGKITINGELLEGEYDVGTKYHLTLTDRNIKSEE